MACDIGRIIDQVSAPQNTTGCVGEEQTATTNEIVGNAFEAARGRDSARCRQRVESCPLNLAGRSTLFESARDPLAGMRFEPGGRAVSYKSHARPHYRERERKQYDGQ